MTEHEKNEPFDSRVIRAKYPQAAHYMKMEKYALMTAVICFAGFAFSIIAGQLADASGNLQIFSAVMLASFFCFAASAFVFNFLSFRCMSKQEYRASGRYVIPVARGYFNHKGWVSSRYDYTTRASSYYLRVGQFYVPGLIFLLLGSVLMYSLLGDVFDPVSAAEGGTAPESASEK